MTYTTLISTGDLASHLDGRWVIVDCRYDLQNHGWGRNEYLRAHIPGAVYASLSEDMASDPASGGGRHPLPNPDALTTTFGRLGISNDRQVILYDQETGMFASRLWWMLRYMGHDAVAVLDGGFTKWQIEGRPTKSGPEIARPAHFRGAPREQMRVTLDQVSSIVADPSALLVDARSPDRFEGRTEPIDRVAGHIPGAVNHYYKQNMASDGTLLSRDELQRRFADTLGDHAAERTVMYCGSGVSACQNLLALEHAGLTGVRLYVGSWSEWSSDPARKAQTGPATVTRNPS